MPLFELKREFCQDVVFWGGGVETRRVFGAGTPDEVRPDVRPSLYSKY